MAQSPPSLGAPLFGQLRPPFADQKAREEACDALWRFERFVARSSAAKGAAAKKAAIDPTLDDVATLKALKGVLSPAETPNKAGPRCNRHAPSGREASRLKDVDRELGLIRAAAKQITYLDLGCAEGRITGAVTKALGLHPSEAYACDVSPQSPCASFTFAQNGPSSLPYASESFDFVTVFMAAHHFADAAAMFQEAHRVTKEGGGLLLREHDCSKASQRIFYDAVHALYECVLGDEASPEDFVLRYAAGDFAAYRSAKAWIELILSCGFELDARVEPHGPWGNNGYGTDRFDSFYALFTRPPTKSAPAQ